MRTVVFVLLAVTLACSDDKTAPAPACFDAGFDPSCTPSYEPTWNALYTSTLQSSCAASGVSCHASTGRQGGLDFGDVGIAYDDVLRGHVTAGKPECSSLVDRVLSTDPNLRMPPGRSLSDGEKCALMKWVAAGAKR